MCIKWSQGSDVIFSPICSSTVYWKFHLFFPTNLQCYLCRMPRVYACVGLSLGCVRYHFSVCLPVLPISIPVLIASEAQILFFKVVLVMLVLLRFLVNGRVRLSSSTSKPDGFLFGITLQLKTSLRKINIFTTLSILIRELVWLLI